MKQLKYVWLLCLSILVGISNTTRGENLTNNQISLSARFGFNISARFKGLSSLPSPVSPTRRTPHGDAYNYDDGYVLTDNTGNFGGQTWYWGYDNSSKQISGNNILMSRSSLAGGPSEVSLDDDPSYGAELVYRRLLWNKDRWFVGLELAGNYLNLSLSDSRALSANVMRTTYPFAFTPGTTPPAASPDSPYQGSPEGPGFVISDTPGDPTIAPVPGGAVVQGHRQFDADIWGLRLGPYVETPLGTKFRLSLSGGLAAGWLDGSASWNETASISGIQGATASGSGHADEMLWGFYVAGNISWQFAERWSAVAGVQYQYLNDFSHSFGGRQVEVNLSESIFATVGISFNF